MYFVIITIKNKLVAIRYRAKLLNAKKSLQQHLSISN